MEFSFFKISFLVEKRSILKLVGKTLSYSLKPRFLKFKKNCFSASNRNPKRQKQTHLFLRELHTTFLKWSLDDLDVSKC